MGVLRAIHDRIFGPSTKGTGTGSRFSILNPQRQEFSFVLGREYQGKASLAALCRIEEYMDCSLIDLASISYNELMQIYQLVVLFITAPNEIAEILKKKK